MGDQIGVGVQLLQIDIRDRAIGSKHFPDARQSAAGRDEEQVFPCLKPCRKTVNATSDLIKNRLWHAGLTLLAHAFKELPERAGVLVQREIVPVGQDQGVGIKKVHGASIIPRKAC